MTKRASRTFRLSSACALHCKRTACVLRARLPSQERAVGAARRAARLLQVSRDAARAAALDRRGA
eukprot:scaffold3142_cov60-Phaeocystis_antarctica.AAC.5